MNNLVKIPGLALLSLSLTDCVDRNGPDQDPIIGDWHAVKIDGEAFPMMSSGEGDEPYTFNVELSVKADLQGTLLMTVDYEYDGYVLGYEQGSTLIVDAGAAPNYRLDVTHDPFEGPGDIDPVDPTGYTSVGYDTDPTGGYGSSAGYDTSGGYQTDGGSGGVHDEPGSSFPLQIPLTPRLAAAELVLQCTLADDVLNCKREGAGEPRVWVFERTPDGDL